MIKLCYGRSPWQQAGGWIGGVGEWGKKMSQEATEIVQTRNNEALNQDSNCGNREKETRLRDKRQNEHNLITFGLGIERRRHFGLLPGFCLTQLGKESSEEEQQVLQAGEDDKFAFECVYFEMSRGHPDSWQAIGFSQES